MSVTIRLSRIGRKNQPAYKMVVANTRDKRNGKYLDILGYYNPFEIKDKFSYDKEKFEDWKKKGALVSDAVNKLIDGTYEFKKYSPKQEAGKEKSEEKTESAEEVKEEPKEETSSEPEKQEENKEEEKDISSEKKEDTPVEETEEKTEEKK